MKSRIKKSQPNKIQQDLKNEAQKIKDRKIKGQLKLKYSTNQNIRNNHQITHKFARQSKTSLVDTDFYKSASSSLAVEKFQPWWQYGFQGLEGSLSSMTQSNWIIHKTFSQSYIQSSLRLSPKSSSISSLSLDLPSNCLASSTSSGEVFIFELETLSSTLSPSQIIPFLRLTPWQQSLSPSSILWAPNQHLILGFSNSPKVYTYDLIHSAGSENPQPTQVFSSTKFATSVYSLSHIGQDHNTILDAGRLGLLRLWDTRTSKLCRAWSRSSSGSIYSTLSSPCGNLLISASESGTIDVWDQRFLPSSYTTSAKPLATYNLNSLLSSFVTHTSSSSSSSSLSSSSSSSDKSTFVSPPRMFFNRKRKTSIARPKTLFFTASSSTSFNDSSSTMVQTVLQKPSQRPIHHLAWSQSHSYSTLASSAHLLTFQTSTGAVGELNLFTGSIQSFYQPLTNPSSSSSFSSKSSNSLLRGAYLPPLPGPTSLASQTSSLYLTPPKNSSTMELINLHPFSSSKSSSSSYSSSSSVALASALNEEIPVAPDLQSFQSWRRIAQLSDFASPITSIVPHPIESRIYVGHSNSQISVVHY